MLSRPGIDPVTSSPSGFEAVRTRERVPLPAEFPGLVACARSVSGCRAGVLCHKPFTGDAVSPPWHHNGDSERLQCLKLTLLSRIFILIFHSASTSRSSASGDSPPSLTGPPEAVSQCSPLRTLGAAGWRARRTRSFLPLLSARRARPPSVRDTALNLTFPLHAGCTSHSPPSLRQPREWIFENCVAPLCTAYWLLPMFLCSWPHPIFYFFHSALTLSLPTLLCVHISLFLFLFCSIHLGFFPSFTGVWCTNKNCMYLGCTMWLLRYTAWFNIHIHVNWSPQSS